MEERAPERQRSNCVHGGTARIDARVAGGVLAGSLGGLPVAAALKRKPPEPGAPKPKLKTAKPRTPEQTVVAFFIAVVVVMLFARLCGSLMPRIGQPRVMGEVLAGILLGPTLFGAIAPDLQAEIFAPGHRPLSSAWRRTWGWSSTCSSSAWRSISGSCGGARG